MNLEEKYKTKIIRVLDALFPEAKIILYGSRARGTHSERSDIDIALDAGKKMDRFEVAEAREMLGASNIPYKIEIVDLHAIPESMKESVKREGIVWKS